MTAAKAIDATTIMVSFDEAVEVSADDFAVVAGDKEFAVSAVTSADAGKVAVLTVAELTVGSKYTVTNGEVSKTVVPTLKDDKTKPAISSAVAITGGLVRVTLGTRNINQDTLVAENFSINNDATVLSVKIDTEEMKKDANVGNTVVLLDVTGLKAGKAYTVKTSNVASYEGAVADVDASKATFAGKDGDTTAPKLASAVSVGGYQVKVIFTEDGTLDVDTATDISNYTITPELAITEAKIEKNAIGGDTIVILSTADQKAGTAYTLKVDNISDGTNVMKEAASTVFAGRDKVKNQSVSKAVATDATKVEVTFDYDANETALDIANYSMNNDIVVTAAEFKADVDEADGINQSIVILTTTAMKSGTAYKLTVGTGVQDTLGQGLKESKDLTFAGKDADTSFTTSITAKADDKTTVKVTFGEEVDRATAIDVVNYKVSDLGYPSRVTLDSTGTIATLTVQEQTAGKSYEVVINNIQDKAGNVIKADTKVPFTGMGEVVTTVKVISAEALSKNLVKVKFNQTLDGNAQNADFTIARNGSSDAYTATVSTATAGKDYVIVAVAPDMSSSYVYNLQATASSSTLKGDVTLNNASGTATDLDATIVGSSSDTATFKLLTATAVDRNNVKLVFDGDVTAKGTAQVQIFSDSDLTTAGKDRADANFTAINFSAATINTNNNSEVTVTLTQELKDNSVYYIGIGGTAVNLASVKADPAVIQLAPYSSGKLYAKASLVTGVVADPTTTKLELEEVTMMNANVLEVKFNTDITVAIDADYNETTNTATTIEAADFGLFHGSTELAAADAKVVKVVQKPESNDTLIVYITGADKLGDSSDMATLKFKGTENVTALKTTLGGQHTFKDAASKEKAFAVTTNAKTLPKISNVVAVNDSKLKVTFNDDVFTSQSAISGVATGLAVNFGGVPKLVIVNSTDGTVIADGDIKITDVAGKSNVVYVEIQNGKFLAAKTYKIAVKSTESIYSVDGTNMIKKSAVVTNAGDITEAFPFGGVATAQAVPTSADLAKLGIVLDTAADTDYEIVTGVTALSGKNQILQVTLNDGTEWINVGTTNANGDLAETNAAIAAAKYTAGATPKYRYNDTAGNKTDKSAADGTVVTVSSAATTGGATNIAIGDGTIDLTISGAVTTAALATADVTTWIAVAEDGPTGGTGVVVKAGVVDAIAAATGSTTLTLTVTVATAAWDADGTITFTLEDDVNNVKTAEGNVIKLPTTVAVDVTP